MEQIDVKIFDRDYRLAVGADDKARLLENGDRWERQIAKNLELDAPYR